MKENRSMLFLYPEYENFDPKKQGIITSLLSDLKIIINTTNFNIKKILRDGSFAYIRCLPYIEIEEINRTPTQKMKDLVRVCVIGYNDQSYEDSYSEICQGYANNTLDISHLIGLRITTDSNEPSFSKPKNSFFDVIIESNLCDLESVLISIMLDTSLYHYFYLDDDIKARKEFSTIKVQGITKIGKMEAYGMISNGEEISYLPFSYPFVKEYFTVIDSLDNACVNITNNLINSYFDFIKDFLCVSLDFNSRKELIDPYKTTIKENVKTVLEKSIIDPFFEKGHSYIVAINCNVKKSRKAFDNCEPMIYAFKVSEDIISRWLSKIKSSLTNYLMFLVKIGE